MQWIKQYWVWLMLALTVLASAWVQQQEDAAYEDTLIVIKKPIVQEVSLPAMQENLLAEINQTTSIAKLGRAKITDTPANIFIPYLAPNDVAVEAEQVPQAPSNPYTYAGKLMEDGKLIVFLTDGAQNFAVQTGAVVNTHWRIQSINPPELTLEYMPLGVITKMQIGAAH